MEHAQRNESAEAAQVRNTAVDQIRRLRDKTTPRPWGLHKDDSGDYCIVTAKSLLHEGGLVIATLDSENGDEAVNVADGELIVEAVNKWERLRSDNDALYVACRTAYDLLRDLTSDAFATGGDRVVRELLADAIDREELNGITTRKEREQ